jgi:hypothetical protein
VEVLSIRHVNDRDFPCTTSRALRWRNYNPINIHPLGEELLPFPGRSIASILTLFSSRYRSGKFHVKFPMMAKVSVKGDDKTPLYQYLTAAPNVSGEITWNFTKFLVARNGQPIARFEPAVTPDSPQVISAIVCAEAIVAAVYESPLSARQHQPF